MRVTIKDMKVFMGATAVLSSRGHLVIPKSVRDELGLHGRSEMSIEVSNGNIIQLHPVKKDISRLFGMFKDKTNGKIMSVEDMDEAIGEAIMERYNRSRH